MFTITLVPNSNNLKAIKYLNDFIVSYTHPLYLPIRNFYSNSFRTITVDQQFTDLASLDDDTKDMVNLLKFFYYSFGVRQLNDRFFISNGRLVSSLQGVTKIGRMGNSAKLTTSTIQLIRGVKVNLEESEKLQAAIFESKEGNPNNIKDYVYHPAARKVITKSVNQSLVNHKGTETRYIKLFRNLDDPLKRTLTLQALPLSENLIDHQRLSIKFLTGRSVEKFTGNYTTALVCSGYQFDDASVVESYSQLIPNDLFIDEIHYSSDKPALLGEEENTKELNLLRASTTWLITDNPRYKSFIPLTINDGIDNLVAKTVMKLLQVDEYEEDKFLITEFEEAFEMRVVEDKLISAFKLLTSFIYSKYSMNTIIYLMRNKINLRIMENLVMKHEKSSNLIHSLKIMRDKLGDKLQENVEAVENLRTLRIQGKLR